MQPLFEHRLRIDGYETRALELEGDGPGLVLLHGWGDSADTWRRLLAELGTRDRRAIAVDLPGFGYASRLPQGVRADAIADFISFGGAQRVGNDALARAAEHAFVHGLNHILVYAAIVAFVGAALATVLTRPQDFIAHGSAPAAG